MAEPTPSHRRLVQVAIAAGVALILLLSLFVGMLVLAHHDVRAFWLRTTSGEQPMAFSIDDVSLSGENGLAVAVIGRLSIPHASVSVKKQFVLFSWSLYPFRAVGLLENHL